MNYSFEFTWHTPGYAGGYMVSPTARQDIGLICLLLSGARHVGRTARPRPFFGAEHAFQQQALWLSIIESVTSGQRTDPVLG